MENRSKFPIQILDFDQLLRLRKSVLDYIQSKTTDVITDTNWIRILTKCKDQLPHLTKITSIKLSEDCDGNDILPVGHLLPHLSKVSTKGCMSIHSSSLALLKAKFTIKVNYIHRIDRNMSQHCISYILAA